MEDEGIDDRVPPEDARLRWALEDGEMDEQEQVPHSEVKEGGGLWGRMGCEVKG